MSREPIYRRTPLGAADRLAPVVLGGLTLALGVMIFMLPPDIVLPVFAVAALAGAALVAIIALLLPQVAAAKPIGAWDIAGALTLIGCAAAILGEIEPLIEYLKPDPLKTMPERSSPRV